jgi:hypothetical protein
MRLGEGNGVGIIHIWESGCLGVKRYLIEAPRARKDTRKR